MGALLTKLTTKEHKNNFKWTEECDKAFEKLKELLGNAPVLSYPNLYREFILQMDVSGVGLGVILSVSLLPLPECIANFHSYSSLYSLLRIMEQRVLIISQAF